MLFLTLVKLRGKIDKNFAEKSKKFLANPPPGVKVHQVFYTLGRYDIVILHEAPSELEALRSAFFFSEKASTETLVAIPMEKAKEMLEV